MERKENIILTVHKPKSKDDWRCVQISAETDAVLMQLYRTTGLPVSRIVSQMIIQGAEFVEIVED